MHLRSFAFLSIAGLLGSCAVGPDFRSPPPPQVASYTESPLPAQTASTSGKGGNQQRFVPGMDIPPQWWALFHSPALNNLVALGIVNNPNIKAAQASLRVAMENQRAEFGALFPTVTGQFSAERERFVGSTFGQNSPGSTFNLFTASVSVSYVLDVFGGIRRQIEAQGAEVDYQYFELQATYLTLTANIVTTAITEASLRGQIEATYELIKSQQESLKIIQQQFVLGGVSKASILLQQTQLAQTVATLPPLEKNLAQTRHLLAVLVGALPSQANLPIFNLNELHLPRHLPMSLPSSLVRQRPDVQAAEALLHQASAQIGVATANLLPQFNLSGSYGSSSNQLKNLFDPSTIFWNITGQAMQTLFDAGTLSARRRAAIGSFQQAYAQYRETVLQAFQNVADTLKALQHDAVALRASTEAEIAARKSLQLIRGQFRLGATDYLALLSAELQYQQTRIIRIQAQALRYSDTAALFQALGGGWWNRPPLPASAIPESPVEKIISPIL